MVTLSLFQAMFLALYVALALLMAFSFGYYYRKDHEGQRDRRTVRFLLGIYPGNVIPMRRRK